MVDLRIITLREGLGDNGRDGVCGAGGGECVVGRFIFQRPSPVVLLWPWKIVVLFFDTCIVVLVNNTEQPSSHSWPIEIKLLCKFGNKEVLVALGLKLSLKGRWPL